MIETSQIQYHLKKEKVTIGSLELEIECLNDLNQAIDQVFAYLESEGDPQALEELCPYFGVIWPSARGLAEYLSKLPDSEIKGQRFLEMGCGLALPSMIAAKKGAQVLATDCHPEVPRFLERNISLNQPQGLTYQSVNWEQESPDFGMFDWIIASDVLYESRYPRSLAQAIQRRLKPHGRMVLADPGRPYLQSFTDAMKEFGFTFETHIWRTPHSPLVPEVFVLVFEKKS